MFVFSGSEKCYHLTDADPNKFIAVIVDQIKGEEWSETFVSNDLICSISSPIQNLLNATSTLKEQEEHLPHSPNDVTEQNELLFPRARKARKGNKLDWLRINVRDVDAYLESFGFKGCNTS